MSVIVTHICGRLYYITANYNKWHNETITNHHDVDMTTQNVTIVGVITF